MPEQPVPLPLPMGLAPFATPALRLEIFDGQVLKEQLESAFSTQQRPDPLPVVEPGLVRNLRGICAAHFDHTDHLEYDVRTLQRLAQRCQGYADNLEQAIGATERLQSHVDRAAVALENSFFEIDDVSKTRSDAALRHNTLHLLQNFNQALQTVVEQRRAFEQENRSSVNTQTRQLEARLTEYRTKIAEQKEAVEAALQQQRLSAAEVRRQRNPAAVAQPS
eukprot:TRINITY_DN3207_c0_g2_i1.p1 TRINITY_DN3207_c0_g2~~TRINITY_DN3207_c0_g2_i1.p1  ORF type:complete len:228 (+),score=39.80 TRINITY_DN3207_c0_g2_i1:22-684(+)